jgi:hypothetical protein
MADDESFKLCRREVGDETPVKFCARAIKHKNILNWCDECRAARLPYWPPVEIEMTDGSKELTHHAASVEVIVAEEKAVQEELGGA